MSAALQLPMLWEANPERTQENERRRERKSTIRAAGNEPETVPAVSLAFYRKHTEKMLRRYLYASMQVGRAPSILGDQSPEDGFPAGRFAPSRTQ
jgi:hypothetical protein